MEIGRNGLCVAKSVVEEFLIERESAFHQSVHTLTLDTTNVMEMTMKRRSAMTNVVQVCILPFLLKYFYYYCLCIHVTVKPYYGDWEEWSVCSKKCGGGISYRKRKCLPSKCPYSDPRYNKCDGNDYEEKKCNDQCCPGMYTTFSTQIFLLLLLVYSCYSETILRRLGGMVCV